MNLQFKPCGNNLMLRDSLYIPMRLFLPCIAYQHEVVMSHIAVVIYTYSPASVLISSSNPAAMQPPLLTSRHQSAQQHLILRKIF